MAEADALELRTLAAERPFAAAMFDQAIASS